MKTNNTAIALIGLLAYKPENIAYISDRLRPEMFPGATLQSCAGAMWAAYEEKRAWADNQVKFDLQRNGTQPTSPAAPVQIRREI